MILAVTKLPRQILLENLRRSFTSVPFQAYSCLVPRQIAVCMSARHDFLKFPSASSFFGKRYSYARASRTDFRNEIFVTSQTVNTTISAPLPSKARP